jgi:hypothetical protein
MNGLKTWLNHGRRVHAQRMGLNYSHADHRTMRRRFACVTNGLKSHKSYKQDKFYK